MLRNFSDWPRLPYYVYHKYLYLGKYKLNLTDITIWKYIKLKDMATVNRAISIFKNSYYHLHFIKNNNPDLFNSDYAFTKVNDITFLKELKDININKQYFSGSALENAIQDNNLLKLQYLISLGVNVPKETCVNIALYKQYSMLYLLPIDTSLVYNMLSIGQLKSTDYILEEICRDIK